MPWLHGGDAFLPNPTLLCGSISAGCEPERGDVTILVQNEDSPEIDRIDSVMCGGLTMADLKEFRGLAMVDDEEAIAEANRKRQGWVAVVKDFRVTGVLCVCAQGRSALKRSMTRG